MSVTVEQIKLHNPIEDVAERYYELVGRGNTRKARNNPSMIFYINTQSYYDFGGSNESGSVIDLIMNREGLDFESACNFLSDGITSATPAPTPKPKQNQSDEDVLAEAQRIKQQNRSALTPALALEGLRELYPFIKDAAPFQHLLGYSYTHKSITFEYPNLSINRKTYYGEKWIATKGNNRDHIPYKIRDEDSYVYLYSGMAEIIACEAMGVSYIGLQMDHSDKDLTDEIKTKVKDKTLVIIEENDDSSPELSKRLRKQFQHVKILKLGENKSYGYDLRDFVNDKGSFEISRALLDGFSDMQKLEERLVQDEIIIPYEGDYISGQDEINVPSLDNCVVVAKTGSGKTHSFANKPGVMILVPRVIQSDTGKGDNTEYVINKIISEGATLTFDKFIGHYINKYTSEFKHYVDQNKFKIIVDEAHMIQTLAPGNEIIYGLKAVFMSGTLEKFFRPNLQRYKFKPQKPTTLYCTNGELPKTESPFVFVEKPKALMRNYPTNSIVGADIGAKHKFKNFNPHQHTHGLTVSTSASREGVSIDTGTYDACMVDAKACPLWSVKDTIQGLNRVRGHNVLRVVTKPIEAPKEVYADFDYYFEKAQALTSTQDVNTIMGEEYSRFVKLTHKGNRYLCSTEFGIVCFLAWKTRNQYDPDLYTFEEYTPNATFEINTKSDAVPDEDAEMLQHTIKGDVYEYPSNKREPFMRWARHKESGFVDRMAKMTEAKNFHDIYSRSRVAQDIKAKYNQMFNKGKNARSYNIKLFYELISSVVKLEMTYANKEIQRVSKNVKLKHLEVKVTAECPIPGVRRVSGFKTDPLTIIEQALNCTAKPVHSAKTANKVERSIPAPKTAVNEAIKPAIITVKKTVEKPKDITPELNAVNEAFLDEISELQWE